MKRNGFSLVEILITLVILAVVMGLTIPKVLNAQNEKGWNANAKQVAAMFQAAYEEYQVSNQPTASTGVGHLTPYMNYVKVDTSTKIDDWQTGGTWGCDATIRCLRLQNGGMLSYHSARSFGNTSSTNAIGIQFDPDGKVTNGGSGDTSATAPGKAVQFTLYYGGQVYTSGTRLPNSYNDATGPWGASAGTDPPWFDWTK